MGHVHQLPVFEGNIRPENKIRTTADGLRPRLVVRMAYGEHRQVDVHGSGRTSEITPIPTVSITDRTGAADADVCTAHRLQRLAVNYQPVSCDARSRISED